MPSDPFYTSKTWKAARATKLAANPTCQHLGCGVRASVVDHIRARRAGGAPFDQANLRSMCWSHHSAKTVRQDGGFGRAPGVAASFGADSAGLPLDPAHRWAAQRAAGADRAVQAPGGCGVAAEDTGHSAGFLGAAKAMSLSRGI